MAKKLRVGVLFGGRSGEHEVSLVSAASIISALDPEKYEIVPIGITKEGRWVLPESLHRQLAAASRQLIHSDLRKALRDATAVVLPPEPAPASLVPLPAGSLQPEPPPLRLDVIFPVLHGTFGEDGTVQGLLELADIPYVGAGVLGSAVGMDKEVAKRLFLQAGLPIPEYLCVARQRWEAQPRAVLREVARKLGFPVFVKPANLGSSVAISKVKAATALPAALDLAAQYDRKLLVERAIAAREIEVSVLGNEQPIASIPGEVIPANEFYDYAAKYLQDDTQLIVPAKLSKVQTKRFQELAVAAFRAIEGEGMARVDFLLERRTGKIFINEINTIPGFTAISMYPRLWQASGLSYPELLDRLIQLAFDRFREKARTRFAIELPAQRGGVLKEKEEPRPGGQ